ncbi:MAG: hypothetical protein J5J00_05620 [Deltaproteobacteria bacterium]|nr:hypothetical protein [Deltaproteobacteria bacterium]
MRWAVAALQHFEKPATIQKCFESEPLVQRSTFVLNVTTILTGSYAAFVLVGVMAGFLTTDRMVAWDLYPQYYLADLMVRNLEQGSLQSYDPLWFGGYPSFTFYGGFPYLITALLHFASFKYLEIATCLNLVIFSLPLLFTLSVIYYSRAFNGRQGDPFAISFALLYLTQLSNPHQGPFGIFGSLMHGHFAAFSAVVLMTLFFGSLERAMASGTRTRLLVTGALLAAVITSHALTTIFCAFYLAVRSLFCNRTAFFRLLLTASFALLLSAYSWMPLLFELKYSSSEIQGMIKDPLLILFPGLLHIKNCLSSFTTGFPFGYLTVTFVVLACSIMGAISLIRSNHFFLPVVFVLALLILPRNFLTDLLPVGIHYNRFIFPMVPLLIVIAVHGANWLAAMMSHRKPGIVRAMVVAALIAPLFWSLLWAGVQNYTARPWNSITGSALYEHAYRACDSAGLFLPLQSESEISAISAAKQVGDFLETQESINRVAVQSAQGDVHRLGTPHFLATWLPLMHRIPVVNGLLAESSFSSGFIIPVFAFLTDGMFWGRDRIYDMFIDRPTPEAMLKRLAMFGVRYLVVTNREFLPHYVHRTASVIGGVPTSPFAGDFTAESRSLIRLVKSVLPFHIFEIDKPRPLFSAIDYKPYFYVEEGGLSFRSFSELWFQFDRLLDYPVIFSEKSYQSLAETEKQAIGGIILSYKKGRVLSSDDLEPWLATGKKVIVLDGLVDTTVSDLTGVTIINTGQRDKFFIDFARAIGSSDVSYEEIVPTTNSATRFEFEHHGGTIINYSYFSRWESSSRKQTIFQITPSFMYVVATGPTTLTYK